MKITQDIGIRICGTGSSVPERKISNDDMAVSYTHLTLPTN